MITNANQYNKNMKIKYTTQEFEAPLFRNICEFEGSGMMYGANGQFTNEKSKMTTEYTKNGKKSVNDELLSDEFDNEFFPGLNANKSSNIFNSAEVEEDEYEAYHCDKMNKNEKKDVYNGDRYVRCKQKSKYIEHSYVPNASKETGGFGNLNRFSDLKQGISTRGNHDTVSDQNIEQYTFHYTFKDYQNANLGSTPLPENTRYANKKYIN